MFKTLREFPGYEINIAGVVRRRSDGFIKKPWRMKIGYMAYSFSVANKANNRYLHRLLAEAFLPNPKNLPEVNHIDGDRSNYQLCNLEWVSHQTNMAHAKRTGLIPPVTNSKHGEKILEIRARLARGERARDIAACLGMSESSLSQIKNGKQWGHIK